MLKPGALRLALSAALAICFSPAAGAEKLTAELDPGKTRIGFVVSDVLHTVRGNFRLKEGHMVFDPVTGAVSGDVIVDAGSGVSGNRSRDGRMTRDVLEAQRYPEIRFTPARMTGSISASTLSNIEVSGFLLIHGQAHEIIIPLAVQLSSNEIIATGQFVVPYARWGMKNPSTFLLKVSDKVEISVSAVGHITRAHNGELIPRERASGYNASWP